MDAAYSGILTLSQTNTFTGNIALNSANARLLYTRSGTDGFGASGQIVFGAAGSSFEIRQNTARAFTSGLDSTAHGGTITVNRATAAATATTHTLNLASSLGGNTIAVRAGGHITSGTAYGLTLSDAIDLSGNPTFDVANNGAGIGTLTLGALSDGGVARTITKSGAGALTLETAATSWDANNRVNVVAGTLNLNQATALGARAAVDVADGATLNVTASTTIGALSNVGSILNSGSVAIGASPLTIGGVNNLSSTFSGVISGNLGALIKAGTGTLTLSGNNTHSGPKTISAGTLRVGHAQALGPSGDITLDGGTLSVMSGVTLSRAFAFTSGAVTGDGIFASTVSVPSGGRVAPGANVGTLTFNALTLGDDGALDVEVSASTNDLIVVNNTNGLTVASGTVAVYLYTEGTTNTVTRAGTYNLIRYTGADPDPARFNVANPRAEFQYRFQLSTAGGHRHVQLVAELPPPGTMIRMW